MMKGFMRLLMKALMRTLAVIAIAFSLLVGGLIGRQIFKDNLVLADMRDRVVAVREFQSKEGRLPSETELADISSKQLRRYHDYDYRISTFTKQFSDSRFQKQWPASGGCVLSFCRGEWNEYYTSWDDRYTLLDGLSILSYRTFWLAACGVVVATLLLLASRRNICPPLSR